MIIARASITVRVRFAIGTRRSRARRLSDARAKLAPPKPFELASPFPLWPPELEFGPALIAERAAEAHRLRRQAIRVTFRDGAEAVGRLTHRLFGKR